MTLELISKLEKELRDAYDKANRAENEYRQAKAQLFLDLSMPKDGAKKPTEAVILSTIDVDPKVSELRVANAAAQADLDVRKMVFKALTFANE